MTEPSQPAGGETASSASPAEQKQTDTGTSRPPRGKSAEPEFGGGARLRTLDSDIDKELEEAMGGLSEKELYGEPKESDTAGVRPPLGGQSDEKRKGRVVAL